MGSSGGGTPRAPNIPPPPANMIMPVGQTAIGAPNVPSFLPQDPTAMATGLTPEMLSAINTPAPSPMMPAAAAGPAAGRPQYKPMDARMAFLGAMGGPRLLDQINPGWADQASPRDTLAVMMGGPKATGNLAAGWAAAEAMKRPLDQRWFWRPLQRARRRAY